MITAKQAKERVDEVMKAEEEEDRLGKIDKLIRGRVEAGEVYAIYRGTMSLEAKMILDEHGYTVQEQAVTTPCYRISWL